MKKRISACIREALSGNAFDANTPNPSAAVNVREEYANAFRTESYNEFWARVLALTSGDSAMCSPMETTTAARLPSYRLFVEHLLDPDQPTVTQILTSIRNPSRTQALLLSKYFTQTANASLLCGLLLKDVDNIRVRYQSLQTALQSFKSRPFLLNSVIKTRLTEFIKSVDPFARSAEADRVRVMQAECAELLKQLESSRDRVKGNLQLKRKVKHGFGVLLVTFTLALTVVLATHTLALLVAVPNLVTASLELASTRRLVRISAQLDAAAKGTYILSKDLETISRLVGRLNDELDHVHGTVKVWLERGAGWAQANKEVVRQLKENGCFSFSFGQQLDELEEHLYLCFMTINRARNLVVKEIIDQDQPSKAPNILSI